MKHKRRDETHCNKTMAQKDDAADRVYEDFEPSYEWAQDHESDTLILMLKGHLFFSL